MEEILKIHSEEQQGNKTFQQACVCKKMNAAEQKHSDALEKLMNWKDNPSILDPCRLLVLDES